MATEIKGNLPVETEKIYNKGAELVEAGVLTACECEEAIKTYLQVEIIASALRAAATKVSSLAKDLKEVAADYASTHPKFIELKEVKSGVESGVREIEGLGKVALTIAEGSLRRIDGNNLTQDFIEGLPKKWVKTKLELDNTAIKRLGVDAETLAEQGLERVKNATFTREEVEG